MNKLYDCQLQAHFSLDPRTLEPHKKPFSVLPASSVFGECWQFQCCLLTAGRAPWAPGCFATSPGPPHLGTGRRRLCIQDESQTTCEQTRGRQSSHRNTEQFRPTVTWPLWWERAAHQHGGEPVYSPSCLPSRDLIVPSLCYFFSCNLQSVLRFFSPPFFVSKNHQDCGQMASPL